MKNITRELPLGFGMALAQHEGAMLRFGALPQDQQQVLIQKARQAHSRQEMQDIVESLVL